MQELLAEAGIGMAEDEFDAVFGMAVDINATGLEECSLEQLMQARKEYLNHCAGLF
jgi:hypothetical protein